MRRKAILTSTDDQLEAVKLIERGSWDLLKCPTDMHKGDVFMVVPTPKEREIYNDSSLIAAGVVSDVQHYPNGGGRVGLKKLKLMSHSNVRELMWGVDEFLENNDNIMYRDMVGYKY